MRNLILAALSLFALAACSSSKSSNELPADWDKMYSMSNADALQEYTAIVFEHSQESIAKYSPIVVDNCLIGPNGIDRIDFAALIEIDRQQARKCWMMLLNYPHHDKRFYRPNTIEYETLHNFMKHQFDYSILFTEDSGELEPLTR